MTYLVIALGGAIGSVLRAWLAVTVARVTGPQFPWGTILINILGSGLIGLVGSLTAHDTRYALMRAFIMVGVCGGFTTFSSFSLQTLELIQAGRPFQAAGNIALSVTACLIAVTLGFAAGAATR